MMIRMTRSSIVAVVISVLLVRPYSADGQVAATAAVIAEIVSTANEINTLINGKKDLDDVKNDLGQIKAKLAVMDQKLDHISQAIDALPGFITESFNDEARRHLQSVLSTSAADFDEWTADPKTKAVEINAAISKINESSANLIVPQGSFACEHLRRLQYPSALNGH